MARAPKGDGYLDTAKMSRGRVAEAGKSQPAKDRSEANLDATPPGWLLYSHRVTSRQDLQSAGAPLTDTPEDLRGLIANERKDRLALVRRDASSEHALNRSARSSARTPVPSSPCRSAVRPATLR